ncbi:hypothetical protein [Variovorax sp. N23]|uniref:hypothetical protein n=1 Tax=Variovorax sp. N23 TaxID=2980555 RepID=UPI0021C8B341|nr:hypothetical protein [Variovorax sp. N23]MCU4120721.1 hypothetical protein [Variovorax sp. N23]
MDSITHFEPELDRCFVRLARFEASVPGARDVVSRMYASPMMHAYMRYSWFKASTPGQPALCLTNIIVADGARGQKHFAGFIERFLDGNEDLDARVLYLENIVSPRFGYSLLRAGFQRCAHGTGEFPTYYLVR